MQVGCDAPQLSVKWHSAEETTGLGFHAERYAAISPSWCGIYSVRARRATFVTIIPLS